jgi:pyruvate/2-oxoglutarate dehydrogenase complex dihydrolipoamide acyltransferase (E2) component
MITLVQVPRYIALLKNYGSKPTVTKWLHDEGEPVEEGRPLAVVETSKASLEIVAAATGTIFILRPVGDKVKIGDILGLIADGPAEIDAFKTQLLNHHFS